MEKKAYAFLNFLVLLYLFLIFTITPFSGHEHINKFAYCQWYSAHVHTNPSLLSTLEETNKYNCRVVFV